jgi:hypothetical protein
MPRRRCTTAGSPQQIPDHPAGSGLCRIVPDRPGPCRPVSPRVARCRILSASADPARPMRGVQGADSMTPDGTRRHQMTCPVTRRPKTAHHHPRHPSARSDTIRQSTASPGTDRTDTDPPKPRHSHRRQRITPNTSRESKVTISYERALIKGPARHSLAIWAKKQPTRRQNARPFRRIHVYPQVISLVGCPTSVGRVGLEPTTQGL